MDEAATEGRKVWNTLELRVLVLLSLFLQVVLLATGNRRKHTKNIFFSAIIWLSYISADYVATLALGVISRAEGHAEHMYAFWAPFLLMHLGGPDTITAYAMADNELWLRHLLALIVQSSVVLYVFYRSFTRPWLHFTLNLLSMLIFSAGFVKYGERSWALFSSSKNRYRDSLVSRSDPVPDYARLMDELVSKENEGYRVSITKAIKVINEEEGGGSPSQGPTHVIHIVRLVRQAYFFFETFKKLFADLILTFQDRKTSVAFFSGLDYRNAFFIVEFELGLVFDLFYTKSSLIFSRKGVLLRCFSCSSTIAASIAFFSLIKVKEEHAYPQIEVIVTYILFAGAVFLELYALLILLMSDRMMISFIYSTSCKAFCWLPRKRWSNSIGQFNVFQHCLNYMPKLHSHSHSKLDQFKQYLDKHLFWRNVVVPDHLKRLIFEALRKRARAVPNKLENYWKDKILIEDMNFFHENDEVEFDQSVLLWHMATDICYFTQVEQSEMTVELNTKREMCRLLSDYMVHLLIMSPFMLPSGMGQIRFQDTCAEATVFFKNEKRLSKEEACKMLSLVDARLIPSDVKGDRSKSLFFDAQRLAKLLKNVGVEERWDKIAKSWVDMLTFAAGQCSWSYHAEKLSQGGEFLTHVWLLMAHFGLTNQFQISEGYIRAKLELK